MNVRRLLDRRCQSLSGGLCERALRSGVSRVVLGALIGSLCAVGSVPSGPASPILGTGEQPALAANNCQYGVNSEWTGIIDSGYGQGSNPPASAIRGQISVNQPSFICNGGLTYWVMVNQSHATQCTQSPFPTVYAQDGWIVDGYGNPQQFYERAQLEWQPNCDPGPLFWAAASWGTSHTYEVQTGGTDQGDWAEFFIDGVAANTLAIDWAHADNYEVAGEIHFSEEYMGGQTIRSLYHCEQFAGPTGCNPSTATNVGAVCPNYNTEGCYGTGDNPNGCYYFNSQSTTYNGFNVYEKRTKSPPSC